VTRHRWLIVLLLVSWTLNVALGVALYHKSRDLRFLFHHDKEEGTPPPPPLGIFPPDDREAVRAVIAPMVAEQHRLSEELLDMLLQNQFDSTQVKLLSDSIGQVRLKMQSNMMSHIMAMHDRIPPDKREDLLRRMIGHLERGHGPGRDMDRHRERDE
jgi:hypothetical protein